MPAEEFLQSEDGLRLFLRRWEASPPKAACILVHGLAEHSGRYEILAQNLAQQGFSVWAMDLRGHGKSEGGRTDCRSLDDYISDLKRLISKVESDAPALPRFLIGHSLGGLIALACSAAHPEALRGVAVSSPALKLGLELPKFKIALTETLDRLLPTTPIPNGINPAFLSRDPEVVLAYKKDPLVERHLSARCAVALRDALADSLSYASRIKIPCLILQAGNDRICDPAGASEFARRAPANLVSLRRYDGLYHELFNEPEKKQVIGDLVLWLESILK